jgi:hypothetical protein
MQKHEVLSRILHPKPRSICLQWPKCRCSEVIAIWNRLFERVEELSEEDLDIGTSLLFVALCCVADRCPDKWMKDFALHQLLDPVWDDERGAA